jgi:hypothetical protein
MRRRRLVSAIVDHVCLADKAFHVLRDSSRCASGCRWPSCDSGRRRRAAALSCHPKPEMVGGTCDGAAWGDLLDSKHHSTVGCTPGVGVDGAHYKRSPSRLTPCWCRIGGYRRRARSTRCEDSIDGAHSVDGDEFLAVVAHQRRGLLSVHVEPMSDDLIGVSSARARRVCRVSGSSSRTWNFSTASMLSARPQCQWVLATSDGGVLRTPNTVRRHPLAARGIGRYVSRSDATGGARCSGGK